MCLLYLSVHVMMNKGFDNGEMNKDDSNGKFCGINILMMVIMCIVCMGIIMFI